MHYPDNNAVPVVIKLQLEVKIPAVFFIEVLNTMELRFTNSLYFPTLWWVYLLGVGLMQR